MNHLNLAMVVVEKSAIIHHITTTMVEAEVELAFVTNRLQMMIAQRRYMLQQEVDHLC